MEQSKMGRTAGSNEIIGNTHNHERSNNRAAIAAMMVMIFITAPPALATAHDKPLRLAQKTERSKGETAIDFNIPAQSLTSALSDFAATTGLQVSYNADLAAGLNSLGVVGAHTSCCPEQGSGFDLPIQARSRSIAARRRRLRPLPHRRATGRPPTEPAPRR